MEERDKFQIRVRRQQKPQDMDQTQRKVIGKKIIAQKQMCGSFIGPSLLMVAGSGTCDLLLHKTLDQRGVGLESG